MADDTGNSSIWVAQRVPDNHVGVVTNGLTVRQVHHQYTYQRRGLGFQNDADDRDLRCVLHPSLPRGCWVQNTSQIQNQTGLTPISFMIEKPGKSISRTAPISSRRATSAQSRRRTACGRAALLISPRSLPRGVWARPLPVRSTTSGGGCGLRTCLRRLHMYMRLSPVWPAIPCLRKITHHASPRLDNNLCVVRRSPSTLHSSGAMRSYKHYITRVPRLPCL